MLGMISVLKCAVTFGGMWQLPQSRGGACFCTRGALQGYDCYYFFLALAKTVTPAGAPGGAGAACAAVHQTVLIG
jgi:hypothetical protein